MGEKRKSIQKMGNKITNLTNYHKYQLIFYLNDKIEKRMFLGGNQVFETVLASIGMGAAKIDLHLNKAIVTVGETMTGQISITGGNTEQKIEDLTVYLVLQSVQARSGNEFNQRVAEVNIIHDPFIIQPAEMMQFPFRFECPNTLPASSMNTKYFFISDLEIKHAKDSYHRDYIEVIPSEKVLRFLEAFERLGLKQVWEGLTRNEQGWSQLIQFHPTTYFYGACDQVTVCFYDNLATNSIEGILEIGERRKNLFALLNMFHLDEKGCRFTIPYADTSTIKIKLEQLVKQLLTTNPQK
jgi:sporulation-control protein